MATFRAAAAKATSSTNFDISNLGYLIKRK